MTEAAHGPPASEGCVGVLHRRIVGRQVRAVSYGEDRNRQVRAGATGDAGRDYRRVSLVVDYAGAGTPAATAGTM